MTTGKSQGRPATAGAYGNALAAFLLLVMIAPLLAVNLPPLNDLLGHMGRYAVQTRVSDTPQLQAYYSFDWKVIGNLGADLLVEALHPIFGIETSVRIIVILAQLLGAAGILAISREVHGRITPFAIAALPLLYGFPFNFGLLNFVLSMALAMLAFVAWLKLQRRGNRVAAAVWLAMAGLAIWVCHTFGWAFLGLLCGSSSLAGAVQMKRRPAALVRHVLGECWPLLLPLVPMLVWRAETSGSVTDDWSLALKARWVSSALRTSSFLADVISLQVLLIFGYWGARSKWKAFDLRLGLAAGFCVIAFLVLPARVFGSYFADMRLVPYAMGFGLLAISPRKFPVTMLRWMTVFALTFFLARMAITTTSYLQRDRVLDSALETIDAVPQDARLATFFVLPCSGQWDVPLLWHVGSMALVRKNAFVNDQWQDPGVNLLIVHYPPARKYAHDPSQLVQPDNCAGAKYPHLSSQIGHIPRGVFTHIWVLGDLPPKMPQFSGLQRLDHRGAGVLYAVRQPQ